MFWTQLILWRITELQVVYGCVSVSLFVFGSAFIVFALDDEDDAGDEVKLKVQGQPPDKQTGFD